MAGKMSGGGGGGGFPGSGGYGGGSGGYGGYPQQQQQPQVVYVQQGRPPKKSGGMGMGGMALAGTSMFFFFYILLRTVLISISPVGGAGLLGGVLLADAVGDAFDDNGECRVRIVRTVHKIMTRIFFADYDGGGDFDGGDW